jgi:hypothetical protein
MRQAQSRDRSDRSFHQRYIRWYAIKKVAIKIKRKLLSKSLVRFKGLMEFVCCNREIGRAL